jgi:hypothetical protein
MVLLPEPQEVLQSAVAEAAGFGEAIPDETRTRCSTAVGPALREQNCHLLELAMIRLGRTITAVAYVEPEAAMTAAQIDRLRLSVEQHLLQTLQSPVLCEVIPTAVHPYGDPPI